MVAEKGFSTLLRISNERDLKICKKSLSAWKIQRVKS